MIPTGLDPTDVRELAGRLEATALTLVAAFVLWRTSLFVIARFFARRFVAHFMPRVATFSALSKSVCGFLILLAAVLEMLNIWAVNVTPAVWTAGIVTAALAFGSQTVIRDIITGFFFLFEDQYDVGDRVELVTSTGQILIGTVDSMGLRTTKVVDVQGRFVVVPNGNIALVTNASRLPIRVGFTIAVPWRDDATAMSDRILTHVREVGKAAGIPAQAFRVALIDSTVDAAVFRIEIQSLSAESDLVEARMRERLIARLQTDGWLPGVARGHDKSAEEEKEIS